MREMLMEMAATASGAAMLEPPVGKSRTSVAGPTLLAPRDIVALWKAHEKLKSAVRLRVWRALSKEHTIAATTKSFGEDSMGTIVGLITAEASFFLLMEVVGPALSVDPKLERLIARLIYAVVASVVAPILDWSLEAPPEPRGVPLPFVADQRQLIKKCLPMIFAWAWKDVFAAVFLLVGNGFQAQVCAALVMTAPVIALQVSPCYRRVTKPGASVAMWARIPAFFSNLSLAVGFAWNSVFTWATKDAAEHAKAPLFVFIIQAIYYLAVTALIVGIIARSNRSRVGTKAEKMDDPEDPDADESESGLQPVLERDDSLAHSIHQAGRSLSYTTLYCVYAFAQLDTIKAFFFTYLRGCRDPAECGHEFSFYIALGATVFFSRTTIMVKLGKRLTPWQKASTELLANALSFCTGSLWGNFCEAAIDHAHQTGGLAPSWMYLICAVFAWVFVSSLYRRSEVERRAWDRYCEQDANACEVILR